MLSRLEIADFQVAATVVFEDPSTTWVRSVAPCFARNLHEQYSRHSPTVSANSRILSLLKGLSQTLPRTGIFFEVEKI